MLSSLRSRSRELRHLFRGSGGRVLASMRSYSAVGAAEESAAMTDAASADETEPKPWTTEWKSEIKRIRNVWIAHDDSRNRRLGEGLQIFASETYRMGQHDRMRYYCRSPNCSTDLSEPFDKPDLSGINLEEYASTICCKCHMINILKSPGGFDPTHGVESALRLVDGAILVLCGLEGVRRQSIIVDNLMRKYEVPRLVFIDNLSRGADPWKVISQARAKLQNHCAAMQVAIRADNEFVGLVDLVEMKACRFLDSLWNPVRPTTIPLDLEDFVLEKRNELIEVVSKVDENLAKSFSNGANILAKDLRAAIRRATIAQKFIPVFMGNIGGIEMKGVHKVVDGIIAYLPSPVEVKNHALHQINTEHGIVLSRTPKGSLVAVACNMLKGCFSEMSQYQVAVLRIYHGVIREGDFIINVNTGESVRVLGLVMPNSDGMESFEEVHAGRIVAVLGVDCVPGDVFISEVEYSMEP